MSEDIWNKCDTRFFVYHSWVPPMCSQVMLWSQHVWRIAMRCNLLPRRSGEGCDMYFMLPKGHFWEARHAENCFSSLSKIMTWVMGQLDPSRGSKLWCPPYHCWWTSPLMEGEPIMFRWFNRQGVVQIVTMMGNCSSCSLGKKPLLFSFVRLGKDFINSSDFGHVPSGNVTQPLKMAVVPWKESRWNSELLMYWLPGSWGTSFFGNLWK